MTLHNIYISTYTTFELIRILWSTYDKLQKTPWFRFIKRWSLRHEMKKIMNGFMSREITSQSDALMNLIVGLGHIVELWTGPLELSVKHHDMYFAIRYTSAERSKYSMVQYDAQHKTFTIDIEPTSGMRDGLNFTITFGQKAPTHIMKIWQTKIVKQIEEVYRGTIYRIISRAKIDQTAK